MPYLIHREDGLILPGTHSSYQEAVKEATKMLKSSSIIESLTICKIQPVKNLSISLNEEDVEDER